MMLGHPVCESLSEGATLAARPQQLRGSRSHRLDVKIGNNQFVLRQDLGDATRVKTDHWLSESRGFEAHQWKCVGSTRQHEYVEKAHDWSWIGLGADEADAPGKAS